MSDLDSFLRSVEGDQSDLETAVKSFAHTIWLFYRVCVDEGFTDSQAMMLTQTFEIASVQRKE